MSIEAATRIPMIAPAATMISDPSKPRVYFVSQSRAAATGSRGISAGKAQAASRANCGTRSRHRAIRPPPMAARKSDRPLAAAAAEPAWRLRSVSAVAIPEGKGSWSMLMSCRLSGMARHTPSSDTAPIQRPTSQPLRSRPVVSVSAGIAETSPALDM